MKNLLFVFLLVILGNSISFSQKILAFDNSQQVEFITELPDTIWIGVGTEQYKGDYSYLDWCEYSEDEEGNSFYSLSFQFFLNKPNIINVPYLYGFSTESQQIIYEERIGLSYSIQVIDKSSINFLIELIESGKVVAILLNENGGVLNKDDFYTFGFLDSHRVDIENGKVRKLQGFSLR